LKVHFAKSPAPGDLTANPWIEKWGINRVIKHTLTVGATKVDFMNHLVIILGIKSYLYHVNLSLALVIVNYSALHLS